MHLDTLDIKRVGHEGHENEIIFIVEELREARLML